MAVRRTNGEGCYVNMPSGKIQMRKQYGFLANGRPRVLSVTGKSRAECNRLMKEKEAKVTGIVSMAKDSTVEELCRCHLSSQMAQRDRLKPTAIDRREGTIKNQIMPYPIAHMQAVSVRPKDIENHIEKLLAESRLSASSIEKVFHVLNGAYKWGISMEYLTYNPCEPVKESLRLRFKRLNEKEADDKDVIVLSPDEIRLVKENALERKRSGFYVHPIGPYVLFLLLTGMRVGELCALRWEHVRWDNDMTVVSIKGTRHHIKDRSTPEPTYKVVDGKTKNMHSRHIVLSEEAASLLKLIYQEARDTSPESYVLVNRRYKATNPSNVGYLINKFYRDIGIGPGITGAHVLRRTFATQEYMKGAELKKIASYIGDLESTTSEYYITVKSNIIMGGKVMNVTPFPMKGSGT